MKRTMKSLITLVALSIPFLGQGQARGSDPYSKMLQIQNAMWKDMKDTPRMSNTYGRKLESNLSQLRTELRKAAGMGRSGRGSGGDSDASDGNVELLITVAMAASDANLLNKLSKSNQEELGAIIDNTVDDLDDDFVEMANEVMDNLDGDLGVDSTRGYRYHRSARYDNPAARRVAMKRRHVTNQQSRKSGRQQNRARKQQQQQGQQKLSRKQRKALRGSDAGADRQYTYVKTGSQLRGDSMYTNASDAFRISDDDFMPQSSGGSAASTTAATSAATDQSFTSRKKARLASKKAQQEKSSHSTIYLDTEGQAYANPGFSTEERPMIPKGKRRLPRNPDAPTANTANADLPDLNSSPTAGTAIMRYDHDPFAS